VSAHFLYMPGGYCVYQDFKGNGTDLSEVDLIAFLLGTCASVAEVKETMKTVNVWGFDPGMGFAPPSHILLHDAEASVAIEFHSDGVQVVDNPIGVGTNAPYLQWQLTNLKNYVGLAPTSPAEVDVVGEKLAPLGQGQGLMGLPGDYTGPSRFVRAATMVATSQVPTDSMAAELATLHILNAFDIPAGLIQEDSGAGQLVDEVTVWASISNLTKLRYSYRTHGDPGIYCVELAEVDFTTPARTVPMSWSGSFAQAPV
jgi:choloylglycine hydrolase